MQKTLTFGMPCYNSAEYMDNGIRSILEGCGYADDIQVVIVDDGSAKDNTFEKAKEWEAQYPGLVKAVHQENGGPGMAVLKALENADGVYFKVLDSDDWVDGEALSKLMETLRSFEEYQTRVDVVVTNYVYEHTVDNTQNIVDYAFALPKRKIIGWDSIGHFNVTQYLLMHALCYRTDVLRDADLPMPAHTFYVDNIYAYVPLPRCKTLYYLDVDLYRYFIGREDQSVNEEVMISRIDQQLRVTRIMMEAYHLWEDVPWRKLRTYMGNYFTIMMSVCSIFSIKSKEPDAMDNLQKLWDDLRAYDQRMYRRARYGFIGIGCNLPTALGRKTSLVLYHIAQKIFKFN